jgi:hypothetical protein
MRNSFFSFLFLKNLISGGGFGDEGGGGWGWGEGEEGLCREISPRVLHPSAALPAKAKGLKKNNF